MEFKGIRLNIDDDGIAVITMCNKDNKFTIDYVKTWNKVLDEIERYVLIEDVRVDRERF